MTTGNRPWPCLSVFPEPKRSRLCKDLIQDASQYGGKTAKREGAVDFGIKDDHCVMDTSISRVSRSRVSRSRASRSRASRSRFDLLPMEILIIILSKLAASSECTSDFVSVLATCRNFNIAGGDPDVLAHASLKVFVIGFHQWCESAHRFFNRCVEAGNAEACFWLGMIEFYCLENRSFGLSLLEKAAERSHAESLFSLAVVQFNGSGSPSKEGRDPCSGAALCSRAALLRNVDALWELGHCFLDGYGVKVDECMGRELLTEAKLQEHRPFLALKTGKRITDLDEDICLRRDFDAVAHPVNRFLRKWWVNMPITMDATKDLVVRLCSNGFCGRVETRKFEFRRCSVCNMVKYCSKACQEIDWKARHKANCIPTVLCLLDLIGRAFFY